MPEMKKCIGKKRDTDRGIHSVKNRVTETDRHRHTHVNTIGALLGPKDSSKAIQDAGLSYRDHIHQLLSVKRKDVLSESSVMSGSQYRHC